MSTTQTHFTVTTTLDGERIHHQDIADPFVTSTTTIRIGWRDLIPFIVKRRREIRIVHRVDGDRHALAHVTGDIPLIPDRPQAQQGDGAYAGFTAAERQTRRGHR